MKDKELTDEDLRKNKYPLDILIKNVCNLSTKTLLRWQILDADFCKKYILDESYLSVEESYLVTYDYILKTQPHLKFEDLID